MSGGAKDPSEPLLKEETQKAGQTLSKTRAQCVNLTRLEVVRDFVQNISLFFSSIASEGLVLAKKVFGHLFATLSLNFHMVWSKIPHIYVVGMLLGFALICTIAFNIVWCISKKLNPDEIRQGHEVKKWDQQKEEKKFKIGFIKWGLRLATLLYLPVSRELTQIFRCSPGMIRAILYVSPEEELKCPAVVAAINSGESDRDILSDNSLDFNQCDCGQWKYYSNAYAGAVLVGLFYTLSLPIYCAWLIYKNKPFGSREDPKKCYDNEGNLVDYNNMRYREDLENDPNQQNCPYLFLYDGYERTWAYYQVLTMFFKLALVVPTIVLYEHPAAQSISNLSVLGVWGLFSFFSSPFLDPVSDFLEYGAIITSLITVGGSFVSTYYFGDIMGYIIVSTHGLNLFVTLIALLWDLSVVRRTVKSIFGILQFTNTATKKSSSFNKIVPDWDIPCEIKQRVWQPFWDSLLEEEGEELAKRLKSLKWKTRDVGMARIIEHYRNSMNPDIVAARNYAMTELEGVDVYYYGTASTGQLGSSTCFGKLYTIAYPFHAVMVYDDSNDYTFIWSDRLEDLVNQNRKPEIQRRRMVRQKLRALVGPRIHYHLERWETFTVEDGTETYKDSNGNTQTRTVYSTITVLMKYDYGYLSIGTNYPDLPMQSGFGFNLFLDDGKGTGTAPRTGKRKTLHNSANFDRDDLDINDRFEDCSALRQLFNNQPNRGLLPDRLQRVLKELSEYRKQLIEQRHSEEKLLSSTFWIQIYDNHKATREEIEEYFESENDPEVQSIPNRRRADINALYNNMRHIYKSPSHAVWFLFWSDVWESNKDLKKITQFDEDLNPQEETSIAFNPVPRRTLEDWLRWRGLLSRWRWITPKMLNRLYNILYVVSTMSNEDDGNWAAADSHFFYKTPETGETATAQKEEDAQPSNESETGETEVASTNDIEAGEDEVPTSDDIEAGNGEAPSPDDDEAGEDEVPTSGEGEPPSSDDIEAGEDPIEMEKATNIVKSALELSRETTLARLVKSMQ